MRCLALEKIFERKEQQFEYLGAGEYKFWRETEQKIEYHGPAEYKAEAESMFDNPIDYHYVKYERQEKTKDSRGKALLTWDYSQKIRCDIPDFCSNLYRWCNAKNKEHHFNYYLDDDSRLHATLLTILPDNDDAVEDVCLKAWDEFQRIDMLTLILIVSEYEKPEPFSLKPLTEYDEMIIKKKRDSIIKVIPMPSPEEGFGDMQKQLQDEINELQISVAAKEISAEEAEAKIKELEQLMQMLKS